MKDLPRLVLASGSPRRREILTRLGYHFTVHTSNVPEDDVSGNVEDIVQTLARRKAFEVAQSEKDALVIASDTLVWTDGKALGKPIDAGDAARMLHSLSGRTHEVVSGICLIDTRSGSEMSGFDRTLVRFRSLSDEEITAYVKSGEPMDKAGAYAIQGGAGAFVEAVEGSYDNIVGFPTEVFTRMLNEIL